MKFLFGFVVLLLFAATMFLSLISNIDFGRLEANASRIEMLQQQLTQQQ